MSMILRDRFGHQVISDGHAPLSSQVIATLKALPPAQVALAAQGYINGLGGELSDAYYAKSGVPQRRNGKVVIAESVSVSYTDSSALLTVRAGLGRVGAKQAEGKTVDITIGIEGEALRRFMTNAQASPEPVKGPDITIRRGR